MTDWTRMSALHFRADLAPDAKARRFVRTAPETLFPSLLPEPEPRTAEPAPELPGQASLLEEL